MRFCRLKDSGEDGFSLVEIVVSLFLFALMSLAALRVIDGALGLSTNDRSRVVAAHLAADDNESARGIPLVTLGDGTSTSEKKVDGNSYTVTRTVQYDQIGSASNACTSATTAAAGYRRVTSTVTWATMGSIKPVQAETLISGSQDPTKGALSVAVSGAKSQPQSGIVVTLNPGAATQTTGSDGCVVFPYLTPGTYTASVSTSGYVDNYGVAASTSPSTAVAANLLQKVSMPYDRATTVSANLVVPAGASLPSDALGISLYSSYFTPYSTRSMPDCGGTVTSSCSTGTLPARSVGPLWPDASGYQIWAGPCSDGKPSPVPAAASVPGGTTATASLPLGAVSYQVKGSYTGTVWAVHANEATGGECLSGAAIVIATSSTKNTSQKVALPYGTWRIQETASIPATTPSDGQTVTVSATTPAASSTVSVNG